MPERVTTDGCKNIYCVFSQKCVQLEIARNRAYQGGTDYPYEIPDDHHDNAGPYWETSDWMTQNLLVEARVDELNCPNGQLVREKYRQQTSAMIENLYLY